MVIGAALHFDHDGIFCWCPIEHFGLCPIEHFGLFPFFLWISRSSNIWNYGYPSFQEFPWKLQGRSPCNFPIIWSLWMALPKILGLLMDSPYGCPVPKFLGLLMDSPYGCMDAPYGCPLMDAPCGCPQVIVAIRSIGTICSHKQPTVFIRSW